MKVDIYHKTAAQKKTTNPALKQSTDKIPKKLNAAYYAVERHVETELKNKIALYWQGDEGEKLKFTFKELNDLSNQFANLLHSLKVKQGDRVFFFLSRVPELYYGYLGTLKRGAVAGSMFAAFGPQAIADRLGQSGAKILVTEAALLDRVLKVLPELPALEKILVVGKTNHRHPKILDFATALQPESHDYQARMMDPEDPAFILYTSGTTGKPKGVIHAHRGIIHQEMSAAYALDLRADDVYWCTADPGWVTGIAYGILGNLSNGVSTLVYEGRFSPATWYQLIQDYKVTVWYTAPTAIRLLAQSKLSLVRQYNLSSLRYLASVGEPLNPEPIRWGLKAFGLPFHDNWWQTETGGILIANHLSMDIKLGSMGKPLPGITAAIMSDEGKILDVNQEGNLVIKPGWPSMMHSIWRRRKKYESYFAHGWYITGDRAFVDTDGY